MNTQFNRMQKLAGIITEGLYTTQMDFESPVAIEGNEVHEEVMDNVEESMPETKKMTKEEFKSKIREMILAERSLSEAKKKKDKEEDTAEEDVDIQAEPTGEEDVDMTMDVPQPGDTSIDINGDGVTDIDAGSSEAKKAFGDLTDAFQAAKALGDEKLIRQIANTITYFNKNIILKQG